MILEKLLTTYTVGIHLIRFVKENQGVSKICYRGINFDDVGSPILVCPVLVFDR
jgi:hypothetical protein